MKTALFLDFDGTIANSLPALKNAYFQFLSEFQIEGDLIEFEEFNGPPLHQVISELKRRYDLKDTQSSLIHKYIEIVDMSATELQLADGAYSLISTAQDLEMQLAIVTSSHEERVLNWLRHNELDSKFSCVVGAESTSKGKPNPDPYLLALSLLGLKSENVIAVEDSVKGASASLDANITTILLGEPTDNFNRPSLLHMSSLHEVESYLRLIT